MSNERKNGNGNKLAMITMVIASVGGPFIAWGVIQERVAENVRSHVALANEFKEYKDDATKLRVDSFSRLASLEVDTKHQNKLLEKLNNDMDKIVLKLDKIMERVINFREGNR